MNRVYRSPTGYYRVEFGEFSFAFALDGGTYSPPGPNASAAALRNSARPIGRCTATNLNDDEIDSAIQLETESYLGGV